MSQRVVGGSLDSSHLDTQATAAKAEAQDLFDFHAQADVSSES
jgi:hypothetical protein